MNRLLGLLAGALLLLASACGDTDNNAAAETAADPAEWNGLVTVEATWQCERQRFAFDSLDDLDGLLADTLARAEVSDATYAAFTAQLAEDEALRLAVRAEFEALCGN